MPSITDVYATGQVSGSVLVTSDKLRVLFIVVFPPSTAFGSSNPLPRVLIPTKAILTS